MKSVVVIWALMFACAGMFIVCDSFSAHWGKTGQTRSLAIFVILSPVSYFLFALINKSVDLAIAGALVNTLIVVGAVAVGVLLFGEQLSKLQYLGIGLALVSVTLLNVT
jgi:multidrug transporter EmrE-like cation transporter